MYQRIVVTGEIIGITEKYIITNEGIFNKRWYRLPAEITDELAENERSEERAWQTAKA